MSQSDVEKIKERLNIEEVVSDYLKLEKAGRNLKARCPFHNEKTPSFIVSPERGTFYCFGCGASGDIFTFVEKFEGLDFSGSLKVLADRAGITLSSFSSSPNDEMTKLRKILNLSVSFYQVCLSRNQEVLKYLMNRGLTEKTIKDWQLGYAPDGWEKLLSFFRSKKYFDLDLEKIGLIKKGERGKFYDRFRNRIMFPIFDSSGRPIGFSGRIFKGQETDAKYLNSPETVLFDKSRILYGFDRAKGSIRKNDFSILVEGQMDLILSHQAGYKNTVASSGTALTQEQLEKIARISEKMVIAYDSDRAGFKASEKAWQMALALGMDVKIAPIPSGLDPADILKENDKQWIDIVKNSRHIIEIIIEKIKKETIEKRYLGKRTSKELIPYLANVASKIDQEYFVEMTSEKLNLTPASIREEIKSYEIKQEKNPKEFERILENKISFSIDANDFLTAEKELFGIIFWQEGEKDKLLDLDKLKAEIKVITENYYQNIFDSLLKEKEALIFKTEALFQKNMNKEFLEKETQEVLKYLKIKYLNKKIENLKKKIQEEERLNSGLIKSSHLQKEIQEKLKEIDSLKEG